MLWAERGLAVARPGRKGTCSLPGVIYMRYIFLFVFIIMQSPYKPNGEYLVCLMLP